jgi:hypothetical protein
MSLPCEPTLQTRTRASKRRPPTVLQVCGLKPSQGVGAPVELTLSPPSDKATLEGWKVSTLKVTAAPGECKPMQLSITVPSKPRTASAAAFGEPEFAVMVLEGVAKGGTPPLPPGGRRYCILVRAWVRPVAGSALAPPAAKGKGKK